VAVTAPARTSLAVLPTPLMAAPRLADALGLGGSLLVKRDDLTGFAVAGNKARQLEFLIADAAAQDADVLVTGGTIGSNFVPAAAAAAAFAGLGCVVVLAGDAVDRTTHPNLAAATAWGAQLRWTGQAERTSVDVVLPKVAALLAGEGARPYLVPRGGANATGALGYRLAVDEVVSQLAGRTPTVVVPVGAGGTLAGLVAGVVAHGRPFRVVGASVSRPVGDMTVRVLDLAQQVARLRGDEPPQASDISLLDARGPGHGTASAAGDAAAAVALRCAGLVLDPVYTAKALAVLPSAVPEGHALFWHTGGLLDAVAGLLGPL
jgi:1-aminocyclopropane-1-carboxylate deaminase/D-cysteine desulfhydrase-like pyridoxal-dependent ACC family enzyme